MSTLSDDLDVLRQQTEDALDRAEREPDRRSQDWRELTPVINVNVAQPKPGSDPPVTSGAVAIGKHGVKIGKLPPVAVVVIAVVGIVCVTLGAVVGYVLTH